MAGLKLLGARLALRPDGKDETTKGGIVLLEKDQEQNFLGTVTHVGPGTRLDNGQTFPMEVEVGDRVMYSRMAGVPMEVDGEELLIINEAHIVAVLPKEA